MEFEMESEYFIFLVEIGMKENIRMIKGMGLAVFIFKMEINMLGNIWMAK
jgi:hypothetical protein